MVTVMGVDDMNRNRTDNEGLRKGRVVQDERGHNLWEGTVRTLKLSLMKTGIFEFSDMSERDVTKPERPAQERELSIVDEGGGFNPYNSVPKKR